MNPVSHTQACPLPQDSRPVTMVSVRTLILSMALSFGGAALCAAQGLGAPAPSGFRAVVHAASQARTVDPPIGESRSYRPFPAVTIAVPANWTELGGDGTVSYAPAGGRVVRGDRQVETTHGVEVGLFEPASGDLTENTNALVLTISRSNPKTRVQSNADGSSVNFEQRGRRYLRVAMTNINGHTGALEHLLLFTTQLAARRVLFLLFTIPTDELARYQPTIASVLASIQIAGETAPPTSRPSGPARTDTLVGSWRTVGLILILRANGIFERVSNSSYGSFGGIVGLDDGGSYSVSGEEIALHGMVIKRTCKYSLRGDTLTLCGVNYTRE
jgi:hypothetical protein